MSTIYIFDKTQIVVFDILIRGDVKYYFADFVRKGGNQNTNS